MVRQSFCKGCTAVHYASQPHNRGCYSKSIRRVDVFSGADGEGY